MSQHWKSRNTPWTGPCPSQDTPFTHTLTPLQTQGLNMDSTRCISYTILCLPCWVLPTPPSHWVPHPTPSPTTTGHPTQPHLPLTVTLAGNDFTHGEWIHTITQQAPSPQLKGQQSHGGVSAWGSQCMRGGRSVHLLEMCMRVDSEQLSLAESLSVVFVWRVLWYFQPCVTIHVRKRDSLKRLCVSEWKTLSVNHRMDAQGMSGICLK